MEGATLCVKGVPMQLVPAGEFTMGSSRGDSDAQPVHQVYLNAYYLDTYEVTNARYKACVDAGTCTVPHEIGSDTRSSYYGEAEFADYPVINVDWNQAQTYCEWRGATLPTEAQWEKAARGTEALTYPWGDAIDCSYANYYGCKGDTTNVGSYESGKSPHGLYDMAGNVWEWVADRYAADYYQQGVYDNPQGPGTGTSRVLRGGSRNNNGNDTRTSNRLRVDPDYWSNIIGFRCSRSQ